MELPTVAMEMNSMKQRVALLAAAALVVAACGGEAAVESTTAPEPAGTAAPAVTAAPVSPTTAVTPATQAPGPTTTTEAPALEAAVNPQLRRIQAAMVQTQEVPSARMIGDISIKGAEDFDGDIRMTFEAAFDNRTGDSSFAIDLSSIADLMKSQMEAESTGSPEDEFGAAFAELFLGLFTKFEVRQVGDTVYMNNPMIAAFTGADTVWIASPAEDGVDVGGDFLQDSPSNPKDLLDPFTNGKGEVIEIGPELVRGVPTTHYQLVFDKEALLESAPPGERAELNQELEMFGEDVVVDVWMDDDYLYKMLFEIDGSQVDAPEGEGFESMSMLYEIYDYNADVVVEAPPADQVTFVDDESLGFDFGLGG
jgi:hypothetical protein